MFKVWYKSIFTFFLIAILMLNLLYFGNTIKLLTQLGSVVGDYSDKYFGITSLLNFFKSYSNDNFLTRLYSAVTDNILIANKWLWEDWQVFANNGGVYDWDSFWTAVSNFFKSIGGLFMFISIPITFLTYLILNACWFLLRVIGLLNGMYFQQLPSVDFDWNSDNYFDWSDILSMWNNIFG